MQATVKKFSDECDTAGLIENESHALGSMKGMPGDQRNKMLNQSFLRRDKDEPYIRRT